MILRDAIGIDPDSKGCQCAFVKSGEDKSEQKRFMATFDGMVNFIRWVKRKGDIIVAIEGSNGQSKPIEKALRAAEVVFYSFKPSDIDKFRKAVLGQNKNNKKDAESVARYAMALEAQGKLTNCKRVWSPDEELQALTRSYAQKTKESTRELNRLWKLLRVVSVDLYLALGGQHPEIDIKENILQNEGILSLLATNSNIYEWKSFSESDFLTAMGERNYKGRKKLIVNLLKVSSSFKPISPAFCLLIKNTTTQIKLFKKHLNEIKSIINKLTKKNKAIQVLEKHKGIGILTASTIIAEIVDIRRFVKEDQLASYTGLGKREYKTGVSDKEIPNCFFNRRLKHVFMTAARNYVIYNPDSHLAGFYKNLVKSGMKKTEARKRVARALVRVFFRELYSLIELKTLDVIDNKKIEGKNDMANGLSREDKINSNISSFPIITITEKDKKIKGEEKLFRKDKNCCRKILVEQI
jgi:transposase